MFSFKLKINSGTPVIFFVDDLRNKWIDLNSDGIVQTEEDHGYAGIKINSALWFLENEILNNNINVDEVFTICGDNGYTCRFRNHLKDKEIAVRICRDLGLKHTFVDTSNHFALFKTHKKSDGIVFSGWGGSELLDRGFTLDIGKWFISGKMGCVDLNVFKNSYNVVFPFLDLNVLASANGIPDVFKWHGWVNKYVIKRNFPRLLGYVFKID